MNNDIDNSILDYLKSLTLLCVEDDKTTQLIYSSIFENLVKNVVLAYDGNDGYQKYCNNNIDLIICDYDMPILNGIEMIKKVRNIDDNIPIILVSAIQEVDIIVQALQLKVSNFIKKPIAASDVIQTILNVSKILIANNYLKEQREKKIKELEEKNSYSSYQEDLSFSKELNIIRNDFYYKMMQNKHLVLIDFFYKPLDILSGDAYSARKISDDEAFYFIVDGMGKGLSASLSSMIMTSYINHIVDKMNKNGCFSLEELIITSLEYIKPILLEEESLSIDFITINNKESVMAYAKFAMPAMLMQTKDAEIIKLKSNNPPISKYIEKPNISIYDTKNILKFLFYSDGLTENSTISNQQYIKFIENDFFNSFSKSDLAINFLHKVHTQEDDITFILINQLNLNSCNDTITKTFKSSLDATEKANDWYADIWNNFTNNYKLAYNAGVVFSELFMNAYEHGNLGLDTETKHRLLGENNYFATLQELQKNCTKNIEVTICDIEYGANRYIVTQIEDEGNGFDTQILSGIFKKSNSFSGRGIYISKKSSLGIYYNNVGNLVLFIHKI